MSNCSWIFKKKFLAEGSGRSCFLLLSENNCTSWPWANSSSLTKNLTTNAKIDKKLWQCSILKRHLNANQQNPPKIITLFVKHPFLSMVKFGNSRRQFFAHVCKPEWNIICKKLRDPLSRRRRRSASAPLSSSIPPRWPQTVAFPNQILTCVANKQDRNHLNQVCYY